MSALLNLARSLGGFSVTYFQVPWALKHGALQVFGCEAAVVVALFFAVVPALQRKGRGLRVSQPYARTTMLASYLIVGCIGEIFPVISLLKDYIYCISASVCFYL